MSRIGGQIEELAALKQRFDKESHTVSELTSAIDGQLNNTWWVGPAADRFRQAWDSEYKPALAKLRNALTEAGAEVAKRRQALIDVGS
jgi:WXG100 family type VII secretion target